MAGQDPSSSTNFPFWGNWTIPSNALWPILSLRMQEETPGIRATCSSISSRFSHVPNLISQAAAWRTHDVIFFAARHCHGPSEPCFGCKVALTDVWDFKTFARLLKNAQPISTTYKKLVPDTLLSSVCSTQNCVCCLSFTARDNSVVLQRRKERSANSICFLISGSIDASTYLMEDSILSSSSKSNLLCRSTAVLNTQEEATFSFTTPFNTSMVSNNSSIVFSDLMYSPI